MRVEAAAAAVWWTVSIGFAVQRHVEEAVIVIGVAC